jgi:hypothetical protein
MITLWEQAMPDIAPIRPLDEAAALEWLCWRLRKPMGGGSCSR